MRMARTPHIEYQSNYPSRVHSLYCFVSNTIIDYFLLKSMHFCIFNIFYKFKHINLYYVTIIHFGFVIGEAQSYGAHSKTASDFTKGFSVIN